MPAGQSIRQGIIISPANLLITPVCGGGGAKLPENASYAFNHLPVVANKILNYIAVKG